MGLPVQLAHTQLSSALGARSGRLRLKAKLKGAGGTQGVSRAELPTSPQQGGREEADVGFPQQLNVTHSKEPAWHCKLLPYPVKRAIPQPAQAIWGLATNPLLGTAPRGVWCSTENGFDGERKLGPVRAVGMGSSSLGVSPHQVGKTKARVRWSRLGQLPWGNLAKGCLG